MALRAAWVLALVVLQLPAAAAGAQPAAGAPGPAPSPAPSPVAAAAAPREASLRLWNGFALGANPLVLGDQLKLFAKVPVGRAASFLTSDAHWRAGAVLTASPMFMRPGVILGFSPLLVLDMELQYGPGLNLVHHTFPSYKADYSSAGRERAGWRAGGLYHQLTANATLKAAYGRLAMLVFLDGDWYSSRQAFYHWELGTVVQHGFSARSRTFVLWEIARGWRTFANHEHFRYLPADYRTHLVSVGVLADASLPGGHSMLLQLGWHAANPDFSGAKIWLASFNEWDFPRGAR